MHLLLRLICMLLSICIPTLNRPHQIGRLLSGLLPQLSEGIEVVVRDDSEGDETERMVSSQVIPEGVVMTYYRKKREGVDAATLDVVKMGKGAYIWTLGDDDEVVNGAVERILEVLRQNPTLTFMWTNYSNTNGAVGLQLNGNDVYCTDGNQVVRLLGNRIGLLSCFLFRKEDASSGFPIAERYVGSYWSILGLIFEVLSKQGLCAILSKPSILNNPTPFDQGGSNGFEVFGVNYFRIIKEFRSKFHRGTIRSILKRNFRYVWRGVIVRWIRGYESPKRKRVMMLRLYWSYPECWIAILLMLLPRTLVTALYFIFKRVSRYGI